MGILAVTATFSRNLSGLWAGFGELELDYLIYNDPLGYADLILNGDPEKYLKNVSGSRTLED